MLDTSALKTKITLLRDEIVNDSITPVRLGSILLEMLGNIRDAYRGNLSQDIEQAVILAAENLKQAQSALRILEIALEKLEKDSRITIVDRGPYVPGDMYFFESLNPQTGIVETSDVWYCGCRFRCLVTGTAQPPIWSSSDWILIEGNPAFSVEFEPVNTVFNVNAVDLTLKIVAWLHNRDITADIIDADIVWERYSEDADGNPRPASDSVWNQAHAGAGKCVHITTADIDFNGRLPRKVRFSATVTLRDGLLPEESATAALSFENLN